MSTESDEPLWEQDLAHDWPWSSNVPHHVTVTRDHVAAVRWDGASPIILERSRVEDNLEGFYGRLVDDRVESTRNVVEHLLWVFRRVRSLLREENVDDSLSTEVYLALLGRAISSSAASGSAEREGDSEYLAQLPVTAVDGLVKDIQTPSQLGLNVKLVPSLAVRHAGSEIFQEAHFEFLRAGHPDMHSYIGPATSANVTRGGAHFTPAPLARSLVEQTLLEVAGWERRNVLRVADLACGSGAMLHETLRTVRRLGFTGRLELIGRDISPAAKSMAEFVLRNALADWHPSGGCDIDIRTGDSLESTLGPGGGVVMNPPFVSWRGLGADQRERVRSLLGHQGDLSMAFVKQALNAVHAHGAVGTLVPSSLLTLQSGRAWREQLLDRCDLGLIGTLGDFGLFRYARVQVAMLVLRRQRGGADRLGTKALVSGNDRRSTGDALRMLRRNGRRHEHLSGATWEIFSVQPELMRLRPTWHLNSPRVEAAVEKLMSSPLTAPIGDVFAVRQGVLTGMNEVFLIGRAEYHGLPVSERKWFRPAIANDAITDGIINIRTYVFYPYNEDGLAMNDLDTLRQEVPTYYENCLKPWQSALAKRPSILRQNARWWCLSERRTWLLSKSPRLISKYFVAPGSFASDFQARYATVQGYAWFLKDRPEDGSTISTVDALAAFVAIFNSAEFGRLLAAFSPQVAGGQFNLSPRYVNPIPIPDLVALAGHRSGKATVRKLAECGRDPSRYQENASLIDDLVADLYGVTWAGVSDR